MKSPESYLVEKLPYGFCPGCSHSKVVDGLGEALKLINRDKRRVAVVSDIGCVGLVDKHLNVNTFHGLHGRSITYATGLKLADPELLVIVVIGDGGTGIGGHHLIHAARRDLDLTVLVFNNFNYGMTGGEHSATTPMGAITSSTPGGNTETPMDLCALSMAAGASFAGRATAFDKTLPETIVRACAHPGFALLDIWELCTAYFMPNNQFKKKQMMALSEQSGMPFGILREQSRRRVSASPLPAPEPQPIVAQFESRLQQPLRIMVAGSAGQKIKTAATTLGRAAILSGLFATQKDDYPVTVKTGHSVAMVMLSSRPVDYSGAEAPDVAVVMTEDGLRRVRPYLEAMSAGSLLFVDISLGLPPVQARVVSLDFAAIGKKVGRENTALWAVAHAARQGGVMPLEALSAAVMRFTPERYRSAALEAVSYVL